MKFRHKDLINAIEICDSVTNTIDLTYTNIPMYKATIQYAEHILNNLKKDIDEEQVSKLKNAIRQLKSDLYLYFRSESKQYLQNYVKDHAEEIIKNEQEIQKKSALSTLGIFTKFDQNDINPGFSDIKATFK
ncbi:hypothetical protein Lgra_2982 [Legionella gratiana]|uniref:Uncharacterized protein n=1 Tax=Legionella gratiana TaxID=45066 RepID=A0A378J781_9GAMM|nr:hypothetical protein [Legionella gratiana]KTD06205.1 hypothetical protein Lgra_2982 [Legionella gratiana]STX43078.1 Uncharacterised protein [Legionella gratiana]